MPSILIAAVALAVAAVDATLMALMADVAVAITMPDESMFMLCT